jgi:hypothetical protein
LPFYSSRQIKLQEVFKKLPMPPGAAQFLRILKRCEIQPSRWDGFAPPP